MTGRTVLVIGATGILRPAAAALESRGDRVIGVARHGSDPIVAVDATDGRSLERALDGVKWDDAIVYGPAMSEASLAFVGSATDGRCVLVRASAAADPARGSLVVSRDTLQLGWTKDALRRWHTPDEISAAALEVLEDGEPRILGTVRSWSDRP